MRYDLDPTDRKSLKNAKDDARASMSLSAGVKQKQFMEQLRLGYMDPLSTFDSMTHAERRAVMYLAYYGAMRLVLT